MRRRKHTRNEQSQKGNMLVASSGYYAGIAHSMRSNGEQDGCTCFIHMNVLIDAVSKQR